MGRGEIPAGVFMPVSEISQSGEASYLAYSQELFGALQSVPRIELYASDLMRAGMAVDFISSHQDLQGWDDYQHFGQGLIFDYLKSRGIATYLIAKAHKTAKALPSPVDTPGAVDEIVSFVHRPELDEYRNQFSRLVDGLRAKDEGQTADVYTLVEELMLMPAPAGEIEKTVDLSFPGVNGFIIEEARRGILLKALAETWPNIDVTIFGRLGFSHNETSEFLTEFGFNDIAQALRQPVPSARFDVLRKMKGITLEMASGILGITSATGAELSQYVSSDQDLVERVKAWLLERQYESGGGKYARMAREFGIYVGHGEAIVAGLVYDGEIERQRLSPVENRIIMKQIMALVTVHGIRNYQHIADRLGYRLAVISNIMGRLTASGQLERKTVRPSKS